MKVVHSSEVAWAQAVDKGPYAGRRKPLGEGKLGCGMWELPPGKKSFPMHRHHMTEEALYVLSGKAKVRTPDGETAIGPGDYVSFPAGGVAHQLINDGAEPLVYLGLSASMGIDIVEYPDSQKVAASVGTGPDRKRFIFRTKDQPDYYEGEL